MAISVPPQYSQNYIMNLLIKKLRKRTLEAKAFFFPDTDKVPKVEIHPTTDRRKAEEGEDTWVYRQESK